MPCSNFVGACQVQVSRAWITFPECLQLTHVSNGNGPRMALDLKVHFANVAKRVAVVRTASTEFGDRIEFRGAPSSRPGSQIRFRESLGPMGSPPR